MSKVRIYGDTSGYIDVAAPATADNSTLDLSRVVKEDANGNVGIGTDSPSNFAGYTALCLDNATNSGLLELQKDGTTYGQAFVDGSVLRIRSSATATGMVFDTNGGNERMRIDDSGYVTMPNQPAFWAYRSGDGNQHGLADLACNVAPVNVGGHYNTSTYRFTAPVDGIYQISYHAMNDQQNTGASTVYLLINGVGYHYFHIVNTHPASATSTVLLSLSQNDYVSSSATNIHYSGGSQNKYPYFSGHLIG